MGLRYDESVANKLLKDIESNNNSLKFIAIGLKNAKEMYKWNDSKRKCYIDAINSTLLLTGDALKSQMDYSNQFENAIKKLESE